MATGRVRAGFFHTRTQPAGLDLRPEPGRISKRNFFAGPKPASWAPRAPLGHGTSGPILWPNKKKNVCLILIFSATKQEGKKNTKENPLFSQHPIDLNNRKPTKPIIFSATNRLETLLFSLQYFPTSKAKTRINIQTLGLNNKTP